MAHEEEWIKSALSDDSAVAELLLLLHRAAAAEAPGPSVPRLDWRVRHRRSSKAAVRSPAAPVKKKGSTAESTRESPTTPLSWSGATSSAGGAEELEESSRLPAVKLRSKVSSTIVGPSTKTTTKRLRRKKTLVELQEEECLLLKEQRSLRQELADLHLVVGKHRATNEKLKKLKVNLEERRATDAGELHSTDRVSQGEKAKNGETTVELPDLNLPVEQDSS